MGYKSKMKTLSRIRYRKMAHHEWIKTPAAPVSYEAKDGTNIVAQDDLHEIPAVDKPRTLKDLVILCLLLLVGSPSLGVLAALVDIQDLLSNILR